MLALRMLTGTVAFVLLPLVSVLRSAPRSLADGLARARTNRHARMLARAAAGRGPQEYDQGLGLRNGWYSPSVARPPHKTVVYRNPTTGQEVTITEVSSKTTPCNRPPDLVFVGEVDLDQWVRGGIRAKLAVIVDHDRLGAYYRAEIGDHNGL